MNTGIPSLHFSRGYSPFGDHMLHAVVRDMGNGVDRVVSARVEPRPEFFPAGAELLDTGAPRWWDLVSACAASLGVSIGMDAVLTGAKYEADGLLHLACWPCIDPYAAEPPPILAAA